MESSSDAADKAQQLMIARAELRKIDPIFIDSLNDQEFAKVNDMVHVIENLDGIADLAMLSDSDIVNAFENNEKPITSGDHNKRPVWVLPPGLTPRPVEEITREEAERRVKDYEEKMKKAGGAKRVFDQIRELTNAKTEQEYNIAMANLKMKAEAVKKAAKKAEDEKQAGIKAPIITRRRPRIIPHDTPEFTEALIRSFSKMPRAFLEKHKYDIPGINVVAILASLPDEDSAQVAEAGAVGSSGVGTFTSTEDAIFKKPLAVSSSSSGKGPLKNAGVAPSKSSGAGQSKPAGSGQPKPAGAASSKSA